MEQQCGAIKDLLKQILAVKRGGAEISELKPLLTRAALEVVKLRLVARQQVEAVEEHKAETADSKAEVDQSNLQLQNLLYEKNYYTKELATCRGFKSKWKDEDIGLVPEEQFRAEAPEKLKEGIDDGHKLNLQRLKFEKLQRLELLQELEGVKQRKEEEYQVVAGKRRYLDDIRAELAAVKATAAPLSLQLALPFDDRAERQRQLAAAAGLPMPLFILFHQLLAVQEAFNESIQVSLSGSEKEAEFWSQASGAEVFDRLDQSDSAPSKKRRKADSKARSAEPEYLAHPLSVKLLVTDTTNKPLSLQFSYLPKLEAVTVKAADAEQQQLLAGLFPDDNGLSLPNESAHQQSKDGSFEYDAGRSDRPYLWAQHLAGLDLLPALCPNGSLEQAADKATVVEGLVMYRKQQRIQTVLQRMRTVAAEAVQPKTTMSPVTVAADNTPTRQPPVKRYRSWEEIAQERSRPSTPNVQALGGHDEISPAAAIQEPAGNAESEEEGALPEEGELPDP